MLFGFRAFREREQKILQNYNMKNKSKTEEKFDYPDKAIPMEELYRELEKRGWKDTFNQEEFYKKYPQFNRDNGYILKT
jgi:hypothetical protein